MEFMNDIISFSILEEWEITIGNWLTGLAFAFLGFELIRLAALRMLKWDIIGDTVTNFITYVVSYAVSVLLFLVAISVYYFIYEYFSIAQLPVNGWTIVCCLLLADMAYYWEHRFTHRFALGWATHTVHHSSPYFNISVAFRFGPLDGLFPMFFHAPLIVLGFHPLLVLFMEAFVLAYQTLLHTETIKKLPRLIEAVMNTPSHHRVHHGSNPQYLDKNYAGVFIIWDKLFGTFEEEQEGVVYGITEPINSINPITVFFSGFVWYFKRLFLAQGAGNKWKALYMPPEWSPAEKSGNTASVQ